MNSEPDVLETYAAIFEKRRRYWDDQIKAWYWVGPSDIELAAAAALRFQAQCLRETKSPNMSQNTTAPVIGTGPQ